MQRPRLGSHRSGSCLEHAGFDAGFKDQGTENRQAPISKHVKQGAGAHQLHGGIRRMQCDHEPGIRHERVDFASSLETARERFLQGLSCCSRAVSLRSQVAQVKRRGNQLLWPRLKARGKHR